MFEEGFFERLRSSVDRVLFGLDLIVAVLLTIASYCLFPNIITEDIAPDFIDSTLPLMTTLIIVTVTSVSILVSLSNSNAITQLKKEQLYEKFLFTFEFTAMLALTSSALGIFLQLFDIGRKEAHIFLFFALYTVFAAATVISRLITYGDKIALMSLAKSLPSDLEDRTTKIKETEEEESE